MLGWLAAAPVVGGVGTRLGKLIVVVGTLGAIVADLFGIGAFALAWRSEVNYGPLMVGYALSALLGLYMAWFWFLKDVVRFEVATEDGKTYGYLDVDLMRGGAGWSYQQGCTGWKYRLLQRSTSPRRFSPRRSRDAGKPGKGASPLDA